MVNTVVIGSEGKVLSPVTKKSDGSYKYALVESFLDTSSLQNIATITGGNSHLISNTADKNIDFNEIMDQAKATAVLAESLIFEMIDQQANHNVDTLISPCIF